MNHQLTPSVRRGMALFLLFITIVYFSGCYYFRVKTIRQDFVSVKELGDMYRHFLVHQGLTVYTLTDLALDSLFLSGILIEPDQEVYYLPGRNNRYDWQEEGDILHEVHIFLQSDAAPLAYGAAQIPVDEISEIRIIEKDKGKSGSASFFTVVGVLVGGFVLLTVIALLTKSSCPYVYCYDGETFIFEGEIYGGAILQNLERTDYLPLPSLRAADGQYRLRISNELKERQFTDLANLLVVNHPAGTEVLLDKAGQPHLIADPRPVRTALSTEGHDVAKALANRDSLIYMFNDESADINEVLLAFDKPEAVEAGKLVLRGKNTLWGDFIYGEFAAKFGNYYDTWKEKQAQLSPAERLQTVIDQHFPLFIYLRTEQGWELVDYLFTVGPLAMRDFVIPVDLSRTGPGPVELKIASGFHFWEMDYAALDVSPDTDLQIARLFPSTVVSNDGRDWLGALAFSDNIYLEQPEPGRVAELSFPAVNPGEQQQSFFLHTEGYYELMRDFSGPPQLAELNKFREPGYFMHFSRVEYLQRLYGADFVYQLAD